MLDALEAWSAAPSRMTQRSQRTPPTCIVSEVTGTARMLRKRDEPSADGLDALRPP